MAKLYKADWLDDAVFYVLDSVFGPRFKHTLWQSISLVNWVALPLWELREAWRFLRKYAKSF